jgi:hypothetical protein
MCLLDELDVLNPQLITDDIQVTDRIDVTLNVNDFSVVEASDNLENSVHSPNMRQESVSKTSSCRGTARETSDIVDGQIGRDLRLWLVLLDKPIESLIGNDDAGLLRIDGGIREILLRSVHAP